MMKMGRRRFPLDLYILDSRVLPGTLAPVPPTDPVESPTAPPGGNQPIIIAPVPPTDPEAPLLA